MADEWYYSVQGNRFGPVGAAELRQLADSGQLSHSDLVWKEGLQSWATASKVKGLFAKPAPPPLPPPPRSQCAAAAAPQALPPLPTPTHIDALQA